MTIIDRLFTGVKDALIMREELSRVTLVMRELEVDVRDHEKRLIRIETIIEFGDRRPAQRQLPSE